MEKEKSIIIIEKTDKTDKIANISYCGYTLSNVHLAPSLSEFKTQFIKEFSLENQFNENDEIKVLNGEKQNIDNDNDYTTMLENLVNSKNKGTIFVETTKIPVYFSGEKSIEFEDEIKNVVERELRIAANNIKKCLTTNLSLSNSKKVRVESCSKCNKQIIGYLYKEISPDENDSYYCELCSTTVQIPLFKIN